MVARERDVDLVAVDDSAARRKAVQMGLRPIGTVGLLVLARRFGHLDGPTALDKLNLLIDRHGLYLSNTIIRRVRGALAEPRSP